LRCTEGIEKEISSYYTSIHLILLQSTLIRKLRKQVLMFHEMMHYKFTQKNLVESTHSSCTTSVHKYMTPLTFSKNFDHSSYSKYLFKNIKF
jgi:hypothetical protein